jgi:hypothetical protein
LTLLSEFVKFVTLAIGFVPRLILTGVRYVTYKKGGEKLQSLRKFMEYVGFFPFICSACGRIAYRLKDFKNTGKLIDYYTEFMRSEIIERGDGIPTVQIEIMSCCWCGYEPKRLMCISNTFNHTCIYEKNIIIFGNRREGLKNVLSESEIDKIFGRENSKTFKIE